MTGKERATVFAELKRIGEETRKFGYIPSRFLSDLANCDEPAELIARYVLAPRPSEGFTRLALERRLDLSIENIAWRYRHLFPAAVGLAAEQRLASGEFDVHTQAYLSSARKG